MTKTESQVPEKRMSDEEPPSSKSMRYDRQLRLWGDKGQMALENASVCLLNATTLGCEVVKNLVLPGVGEIHIVDDSSVSIFDVQSNYFLSPSDIGKPRVECVISTLTQLNPDTKHHAYNIPVSEFIQRHLDSLKRFSVFVISNLNPVDYKELSQIAWDSNIPIITADIVGLYSVIRIIIREHCIIESKPDTPLPDLHLDKPFTELIDFYQNMDFDLFSDMEHAHIPFVLILLKCLDQWKAKNGGQMPKNYKEKCEFKKLINSLRRKPDEENFNEACKNVNKCVISYSLPGNIAALFEDTSCNISATSSSFWLTAAAVKQFYNVRGVLPVSGVLEDMTADTQTFIALQNLYQNKAIADANAVEQYLNVSLKKFELPVNSVSRDYVRNFSKNSRFLHVLKTDPIEGIQDAVKNSLKTYAEEPDDLCHIVLLFKACQLFVDRNCRWPGVLDDNLISDEVELSSILKTVQQSYDMPEVDLVMLIKDFVRYGGTEMPSVAAFSGGIAAHECIKLITCQYIPVDNCFVYNGGTQVSSVYKY